MATTLEGQAVARLETLIEEATRSTEEGVKYFVEPAPGTRARASSKRHHIVFGRRGSGKSSLLQKVRHDSYVERRPVVYVDMEEFKGHSYPDVLVSVLIRTFIEFERWLNSTAVYPATKTGFWKKLVGAKPTSPAVNAKEAKALEERVHQIVARLKTLLHEADSAVLSTRTEYSSAFSSRSNELAAATVGVTGLQSKLGATDEAAESQSEKFEVRRDYNSSKEEYLHRSIIDFKNVLLDVAALSGGPGFILLDDLYHIRLQDQADVIDYFHRICKNTNVWLKIGTVRHRTKYYLYGDPPKGMKVGDDCEQIDLDVTLEQYVVTKQFLFSVLEQFARECTVNLTDILTDGARDRLVVASGGVARDFLTLFRSSMAIARERWARGDRARGEKIGAEDVNVAAGRNDANKREEFARDLTVDDFHKLLEAFERVSDFCLSKAKANCFLVEKDARGNGVDLIPALVDLKFLHRVSSRVTVRDRPQKLYDAYMLDLSQYAGERAKRGFEIIEFWMASNKDSLRRTRLVFLERAG